MPPGSHAIAQPPTSDSPEGSAAQPRPDAHGHTEPPETLNPAQSADGVRGEAGDGRGDVLDHEESDDADDVEPDDDDDETDDETDDDDGYGYGYEDDGDGAIHDYCYKPCPVFHGQGPLFLGLELEVATPPDNRSDCARTATSWLGSLGYLKSDSSIDHGFEIVTHPMSYRWAIERFPWPMLPALTEDGAEVTRQTGLHVHLSRAGFDGPCHAYRWMKFVYRNQAAVTTLARRSSSQWAQFSDEPRRAVKEHAKGALGYYRYWAINASNADTFELRVFASSLQPVEVQAALGFAAASVEYTRDLTVPAIVRDDGWSWPAFTAWLADRPGYCALREQAEVLACAC
jgi:hypothetical protein